MPSVGAPLSLCDWITLSHILPAIHALAPIAHNSLRLPCALSPPFRLQRHELEPRIQRSRIHNLGTQVAAMVMALASTAVVAPLSCGFLPSLSSALSVERRGRRRCVVAQLPSYGIPSYGAPRPYQTPGADFHNGARPAETIANPSFGDKSRPDFQWNYRAPADYSTPVSYQTPNRYGAPQAYGPGATELGAPGASFDAVKQAELDAGDNGGSGDDNGGGSGGRGGGDGDGDGESAKKKLAGLSMSQKLTLAYAIIVGVGGIMGFVKSGSNKSLLAGGGSALILYYVFTNLPTKPIMASVIGLGISGVLSFVMGSRFSETGKVFPTGVVSLYSLVMAGGYIHGIMRGY